uniref:LAGLIDADG endonuclease n=1 Tax=Morchella brunnea TaxID=1174671 RepID=A0A8K1MEV4_9PEZI|nr:LAGLIDADG endonuclease [Morchella brunnea]UBU98554.1 LAGLIDADG endonuclease [Morchella brunnea]
MVAFLYREVEVINFAVCWKSLMCIDTLYSENSIYFAQSAGNLCLTSLVFVMAILFVSLSTPKSKIWWVIKRTLVRFHTSAKSDKKGDDKKTDKRTSETTRETSFNFREFRAFTGLTPEVVSDAWLTWFIGFSEGDGAILTGHTNDRPRFVLTQKEISILNHVHETLGFGRVRTYGSFSRFLVDDKKGILALAHLFNGNLVLDKRKIQLNKWLDLLNITSITSNVLPLLSNAWLSGLIDAEGCFNVTLFKRKAMTLGYQVKLRFMIDQKDSLNTLLFIKNQWDMILSHRKLAGGDSSSMYRVETNSFVRVKPIIEYLNIFRLKTKKQISFDKWVSVHKLVCEESHLTEQGLNEIIKIKKEINLTNSITGKTGSKLA